MRISIQKIRWAALFALLALFFASSSWAEVGVPPHPGEREKCPVCGMFVAKYPDWVAAVAFNDGHIVYFDGAKDMFKYYFDVKKYDPDRSAQAVRSVHVTEYYDMRLIPAEDAFFVIGGDVYGPMGRELIPLASAEDAETFSADHGGKQTLRFDEVTPELIGTLD
jgi:nitrous oxide reductase accessory protein NosL